MLDAEGLRREMQALVSALSTPGAGERYAATYGVVYTCIAAFYLPLVIGTARAVRSGALVVPAAPLKLATFLYNVVAGGLSAYGFALMCKDPTVLAPTAFYAEADMLPDTRLVINLFCLTKCFEFVDTFLCSAFKGKDPSFLHAFHHIATSIGSWYAVATRCHFQHYPVFMNLLVHAIMFAYFAAVALHPAVKRALSVCRAPITGIQLVQMSLGTYNQYINVTQIGQHASCADPEVVEGRASGCYRHDRGQWIVAWLGLLMYAFYILIFGKFFLEQYVLAPPADAREKKSA